MQRALSWESLIVAMTVLMLAPPGAAAEIRGFRGIAWGDSSIRLGQATQVSNVSNIACYTRETESLVFGDSTINSVRFCFRQDRLFMVAIDFKSPPDKIRAEFQTTYGPPDKRSSHSMSWLAKATPSRAELVFAKGQPTVLSIYSVKES